MIRLFVGLGNPGPEYSDTRHNAGFWWIDELARRWKVSLTPERSYHGLAARANLSHGPVWLLQPMTYMNLSGKSVSALARFYKITPQEILVVHDELDIEPGQAKLKQGGSAAGHNGLKDIQAQMGSADFWRLRLGIGHPGDRAEVAAYVLRKPPATEREQIELSIERTLPACQPMLHGDMAKAIAAVHAKPQRPKPPKPERKPDEAGTAADPTAPSPKPAD